MVKTGFVECRCYKRFAVIFLASSCFSLRMFYCFDIYVSVTTRLPTVLFVLCELQGRQEQFVILTYKSCVICVSKTFPTAILSFSNMGILVWMPSAGKFTKSNTYKLLQPAPVSPPPGAVRTHYLDKCHCLDLLRLVKRAGTIGSVILSFFTFCQIYFI